MANDLYVIHENDYMQHITDKVALYNMVRTIAEAVRELPECDKLASLKCAAANMAKCAQMMFDGWGIPEEYLEEGDRVHLTELFEEELLPVEDYIDDDESGGIDNSSNIRMMAEMLTDAIDRQTTVMRQILVELSLDD